MVVCLRCTVDRALALNERPPLRAYLHVWINFTVYAGIWEVREQNFMYPLHVLTQEIKILVHINFYIL